MDKPRMSLRAAIVLVTLCAVFFAWVAWKRNRASDRLDAEIAHAGPALVESVNSGDAPSEDWWAKLLADTSPRPGELKFYKAVDNELANTLASSQATDQIHSLMLVKYSSSNSFFKGRSVLGPPGEFDPDMGDRRSDVDQPFFSADCPLFFKSWPTLERLVIRDVAVPVSWFSEFNSLPALKEIVISGGLCNFDPESLQGIPTLERAVFCRRGITQQQLEQLREKMPHVTFEVLGCFETKYQHSETEKSQTLSRHDPEAYKRMKELLDRVNEAIVAAGGDNTHPGTPATVEEIAALEHCIGVPLPKSLRAFYEVTNGWKKAPMFIWNGIRSTQKVADDYRDRMGYVYKPDEYDFAEFKFDQFANPNAIPINDEEGMHFNQDRLCHLDLGGESGPYRYDNEHDLFSAFESVLKEMAEKKFDNYKGHVHSWVESLD